MTEAGRSSRSWFVAGLGIGAVVALVVGYVVWSGTEPLPCPDCPDEAVATPQAPTADAGTAECPPPPPCKVPATQAACNGPEQAALLPWDRHPAETLPAVIAHLRRLVREDPTSAEIDRTIDGLLDPDAIATVALSGTGPDVAITYWQRLDLGRRREFMALFKKALASAFRDSLLERSGDSAWLTPEFLPAEQIRLGEVSVSARDRRERHGQTVETSIVFRMGVANGAWRVVDLDTDGVSLTGEYREIFQDLLEREATFEASWAAMMERLRKKVAEGLAPNP